MTPDIILENDTSGFLAAVKLDGATPTPGEDPETQKPLAEVDRFSSVQSGTNSSNQNVEAQPVSAADAKMLSTLVNVMADSMNALFDDSALKSFPTATTKGVRNDIRSAIAAWSDSQGPQFNTDFGISFDFENPNKGVFKFSSADQHRFMGINTRPATISTFKSRSCRVNCRML